MKSYYTLLFKNDDRWEIAFGDYVRAVVKQELVDMAETYGAPKSAFRIIQTEDQQSAINEAVAMLNEAKP